MTEPRPAATSTRRAGSRARRRTGLATTLALATVLVGAGGLSTTAVASTPSMIPAVHQAVTQSLAQGAEPPNTDGWWYRLMGLAKAHRQATGKGVTIALIDAAIDPAFKDLQGAHIVMKDNCDGDHVSKPQSGRYGWHGDSMASYLVGTGHGNGPGGAGVRGVVPDATVNFYQVNTQVETPPEQPHYECDAAGLAVLVDKAVADGADIISISLTANGASLRLATQRAMRRGVVVVASSGDAGSVSPELRQFAFGAPAAYPGVVAVYAADRKARPWVDNPVPKVKFGRHAYPTITAPGVDIRTPVYKQGVGWSSTGILDTGTSPSTAIVAGSLALVKSAYPKATGNQLIQSLIHDTGGSAKYGYDPRFGYGIVSVTAMLAHDPTKWPDVNPLLHGPKAAVRDFPASSYGRTGSAGTSKSTKASSTKTTGASGKGTSGSTTAAAAQRNNVGSSRGGLPIWVWSALAVLLALGVAVLLVRRGRARPRGRVGQQGTDDQSTDDQITDDQGPLTTSDTHARKG